MPSWAVLLWGALPMEATMAATIDWRSGLLAFGLVALAAGPAGAAPGDIYRVAHAETVNLRAGPSDQSNVRGTVQQGDQVIELARADNWIGVRVLRTGEEGWIFSQLLEAVARSTLGTEPPVAVEDVGFMRWSESFNRLLASINGDLGYPTVQKVEQPEPDLLRVVPTTEWLRNAGRDAHLMGAAAMYEMWKNHQNGGPVRLVIVDDQGRDYIQIADQDGEPNLSIKLPEPQ